MLPSATLHCNFGRPTTDFSYTFIRTIAVASPGMGYSIVFTQAIECAIALPLRYELTLSARRIYKRAVAAPSLSCLFQLIPKYR